MTQLFSNRSIARKLQVGVGLAAGLVLGLTVWFNYRETRITHQRSYFARLHYTHDNPVKHGLVPVANHYPWCSAAWFERTASAAMVKAIYRFRVETLKAEIGSPRRSEIKASGWPAPL